ncbi:unnamed protein product, partial [Pocillopora meandrina]
GLRTIFKQEWDNRYKTTLGEWKDQPKNGMDFWNAESTRNRKRNAVLLTTMKNGDRAEWDCTMLFYAILYSDCIYSLNPSIRSNADDLRKFRNEEFAHMPRGHLSNGDFQTVITKVKTAFHALGLPSLEINEVQNQTNFLTEELNEVLRKVDDLKQEVKDKEEELQVKEEQRLALEEQLNFDVSPFCILPPKPSHDIASRESEVGEVLQNLQTLKDANDGLSILYLSGNPGSGKSQLARLAARRFYDEVEQIPSAASFVMTLNAENSEALLKSYVLFAQHCNCPGYEITNTYRSKDLNTDEKISYFKTLISTKIEHYASWLLPILQDIIIEYVKTTDDEFEDEDMIRTRMNRCSLLIIEEESTGVYIRVHGVVLDVIKSATKGFAKDQSHKVVYGAVMSFSKFEELESIVVGTRIVPHLTTLSLKIEDMSLGKGIPEASNRALSYNNLGTLHTALGDTDEAKDCYKRALEIKMKQLGPEHVDVASSYNNLGNLHSDLGDTDEAKDCYKRALEIQMKQLGPEHVDVARSYNNLGDLHSHLG